MTPTPEQKKAAKDSADRFMACPAIERLGAAREMLLKVDTPKDRAIWNNIAVRAEAEIWYELFGDNMPEAGQDIVRQANAIALKYRMESPSALGSEREGR